MKLLTAAVILAIGVLDSAIVHADPTSAAGACYSINDQDVRNYCRAKVRKDSSICYAIQRQDMRSMCLAETRK